MQVLFSTHGDIPRRIARFGATGTCTHIASDAMHAAGAHHEFVGYIADEPGSGVNAYDGAPVFTLDDLPEDVGVLVPVMDPAGRRSIFERLHARGIPIIGSRGAPPNAHPSVTYGEGSIVAQPSLVGPGVRLGRGVIVVSVSLWHDSSVGDFSTVGGGVAIPGHVEIGSDVWVGMGASFTNGTPDAPLRIGDGAVIGVGAIIVKDVAPCATMISPRARSVEEWRELEGRGASS